MVFAEFAGIKPRRSLDELIDILLSESHSEERILTKSVADMLKSRAKIEEFFADLRTAAKETLDEAAGKIMSYEPEIVGLSSTFMQHNASIALMKRLRD